MASMAGIVAGRDAVREQHVAVAVLARRGAGAERGDQ
jgi:hypothetical protein